METKTPVLIVGGGGAGLVASMLLSKLGIDTHSRLPVASHLGAAQGPCPEAADGLNAKEILQHSMSG